jgi:rhomboid protease GluP
MRIETKFVKNYLSKSKFSYGVESVIIVLGLCLVASLLYWNPLLGVSKSIAASYSSVLDGGEYWRLFTTSFVHGGIEHLLSNSLMLCFLTYFVSTYYGSFIGVILSFIVAMITNLIVLNFYGGSTSLVGASGVVYYHWGFWMII